MSVHPNAAQAERAANYLQTHFAQFMISTLKATQNMSSKTFNISLTSTSPRSYSDQDLYTMFGLSKEEIAHIENTTKDFPIYRKAKRTKAAAMTEVEIASSIEA